MEMAETIVTIMIVCTAGLMTFFILLQEGKGGGLASLGGTKAAGVEGVTNPIRRATGWLAGIMFVLLIVLGIMRKPGKSQFAEEKQAAAEPEAAAPAEPAPGPGAGAGPIIIKPTPPAVEKAPEVAPKTDNTKPEAAPDAAKNEPAKPDAPKPDAEKPDATKTEQKADGVKNEPKTETPKVEAPAKADEPKK